AQGFLPALVGLALLPSGVIEVIRFHRPLQLTLHLLGERGMASPPAPAIPVPVPAPQLSGHAPRRAGETQEKRRQYPGRERPFALVQQGLGEVIEGALATIAPVAFAAGAVVVRPPRIDVLALAPGTVE